MKKVIEICSKHVTLRLTAESTSAAEVESAIEMLQSVRDPSDVRVFYLEDDD